MADALMYLECKVCKERIMLAINSDEPGWDFSWEPEKEWFRYVSPLDWAARLNQFGADHLHESEFPTHFHLVYERAH